MKIIGITGRSGSGKSAVSALYRQLGYTVADADRVARQVLEPGSPCLAKLAAAFGPDAFTAQGAVDRQKLAARAFRDETSTQTLIDITHPEIVARLLAAANEAAGGTTLLATGDRDSLQLVDDATTVLLATNRET